MADMREVIVTHHISAPGLLRRLKRTLFDAAAFGACGIALALSFLRPLRKLVRRGRTFSLWAGTPIVNMSTNAKAEQLLGGESRTLVYETYFLTSAFDFDLSRWSRIPVFGRLLPLAVFIWACVVADRLHFFCDRGLLPSRGWLTFDFRELHVYRMLGIPVFLWTYGADVRSRGACRSMGEPNCCTHCDAPGRYCVCDDQLATRNHAKLKQLSTAIFAGVGDMFVYTPGSIDDTFFWPVDLDADGGGRYAPRYPRGDGTQPLRIVHSSNHRMFKGTDYLVKAVDVLKQEGLDIDLALVERVPNREALEIYRSADVIFDQCLLGGFGYFALEGMALGKPVMCFIRHAERYLLRPEECPVINTHISTLADDLRRVYHERATLPEIGRRGRSYVERHFSLAAFAGRLGRAYRELGVRA